MSMTNIEKQEAIQAALNLLEANLAKHVANTILRDREDVLQDVKAKIIEKAYEMFDEEPMGFFDFIEKEVLKEEIVL